MLLNFHNPSCAYNHIYNLRKKSVSLLQSIFTSLVHPYLSTKSSLLSPLTLPSTTSAIFHLPIFVYNHPNNLHQKHFPNSAIYPIQAASRDRHCFNISILPHSMDSDNRAHDYWFLITKAQAKNWCIVCSSLWWRFYATGMANYPIHLLSYAQSIAYTSIPY